MKANLACTSLVVLLLASTHAFALELGEPRVETNLGEPLRAMVPVTDVDGLDIQQLRATVASDSAFMQAGLVRQAVVDDIEVSVIAREAGPMLSLKSKRAVRDPFLDVILVLEWPDGQEQYPVTLLFDPPGYAQSPSLVVPLLVTSAEAQPVSSASPDDEKPIDSVEIGEGDTLWSLAARLRPGEDIAIQQMILALVDANPTVFPNSNLNRMRTGQRLVVPSREMIEKRTAPEAKRQFQALKQPSSTNSRQGKPPASGNNGAATADKKTSTVAKREGSGESSGESSREGSDESSGESSRESANATAQDAAKDVDVAGANEVQVPVESDSDAEKASAEIETPQLVDRRMAALALEKERRADRDELEVLRNRNQSIQGQVAQQQQELIELQEQLNAANARARQAEQEVQQASTPWWRDWGNQGLLLAVAALALIIGSVVLRKSHRPNGESTLANHRGETVASGSYRRDNEPVITPSSSSEFGSDKRDA